MRQNSFENFLAKKCGPDNFLQYSISPFQKKHAIVFPDLLKRAQNKKLASGVSDRFGEKHVSVTESGREALALALSQLDLKSDDEVWIETTTNNFYISGCVTRTVERFCKWSRSISPRTKAIILNHEFGFPIEKIAEYSSYNLPIIEDCAFSFLSENSTATVGLEADFVIVSFPKFLPVPWGGALFSKSVIQRKSEENYGVLNSLVNHYLTDIENIRQLRRLNYCKLEKIFIESGMEATFKIDAHHTPGVFMFNTPFSGNALNDLKAELNGGGIQSSIFYGRDAYFIPCHHELDDFDINYLAYKTIEAIEKRQ